VARAGQIVRRAQPGDAAADDRDVERLAGAEPVEQALGATTSANDPCSVSRPASMR